MNPIYPCPFCGARSKLVKIHSSDKGMVFVVECDSDDDDSVEIYCNATGPVRATEEAAVKAWNSIFGELFAAFEEYMTPLSASMPYYAHEEERGDRLKKLIGIFRIIQDRRASTKPYQYFTVDPNGDKIPAEPVPDTFTPPDRTTWDINPVSWNRYLEKRGLPPVDWNGENTP